MLTNVLSNLGLLTLLAFLGSLLYRDWPPGETRKDRLARTVAAGLAGALLSGTPLDLAPAISGDLRQVPTALIALALGPGWGLLAAVPGLLVAALTPVGLLQGLLSAAGTLLSAALLRRALPLNTLGTWQTWWVVPLLFVASSATLLGSDRPHLQAALAQLLASSVAFVLVLLVLQSRLRLLRATFRFREEAHTDPLTGLANRRQLALDQVHLRDGDHLMMVDIDHFKRLNDTYGHAEGDRVLQRLAQLLSRSVRSGDRVYRVGGEEFALLLHTDTPDSARRVAERCLTEVRREPATGPAVTVSAGLSAKRRGETFEQVQARADALLYAAKASGRNRLVTDGAAQTDRTASWQAVRGTLALLSSDREPQAQDWLALLQAAVESVPGAQAGTLYVREDGDLVLRAQLGFSDVLLGHRHSLRAQQQWYAAGRPDWQDAWAAGQPRVMRGSEVRAATRAATAVDHNPRAQALFEKAGRLGDLAVTLGVPVVVDGEVVALLNLDRFDPGPDSAAGPEGGHAFDAEAQATAAEFAAQAALLLAARARRQREVARRRTQTALAQVAEGLRDATTSAEIIAAMTGTCQALLSAQSIVSLRYDRRDGRLHFPGEALPPLPQGAGLSGAALSARAVLRTADARLDARVHPAERPGQGPVASALLAAPLLGHAGPVGALLMARTESFGEDDVDLVRTVVSHGVTALERVAQLRTLQRLHQNTLRAMGLALEARGLEPAGHTERVAHLAWHVGRALGLGPAQCRALREGAYLHDLGKLEVPRAVLLKAGELTAEEWLTVREHAEAGEALARPIPHLSEQALSVIRSHHERWDGLGYPDGLAGDGIPYLARIFAVCEAYDQLTSHRPYRQAVSAEEALNEVQRHAGTQFDPQVVTQFTGLLRRGEVSPLR
ncbi:diguanylate cyclase domain-containing protein [Deinococcus navajonensis]|uniref:Diguanylate cyclase domain-containing protein n=1 Tax=Deinococcus navajonensis TaxID=309884 RepID=A0ABV8XHF3_9DEIO